MIEAVFFDIGGTVHTQKATDSNDIKYAELVWNLLNVHGLSVTSTPQSLLSHIDAGAREYKAVCEMNLIELPVDEIWSSFFLKDYSFSKEKLSEIAESLAFQYDRYRKVITIREGLHECLFELKEEGVKLGIVSNIMSHSFVPRILDEYGVREYFEVLTLSCDCGIRKPNSKIFDIACSEMGVDKGVCAYVGDTLSRDVQGANNAGWPLVIQIDNPLTYHKDEEFRNRGLKPDVCVRSLREIPAEIKRFR